MPSYIISCLPHGTLFSLSKLSNWPSKLSLYFPFRPWKEQWDLLTATVWSRRHRAKTQGVIYNTSEQSEGPLLEDFPPVKKKRDECSAATSSSEEFYLIISAPRLQHSLMNVGWAKERISHLSLRNPQPLDKGHILRADHTKVHKTHSYKTNKFIP